MQIIAAGPVYCVSPVNLPGDLKTSSDIFADIIDKIKPGVVFINVRKKGSTAQNNDTADLFFKDPDIEQFFGSGKAKKPVKPAPSPSYSRGSGFIISPDGYILTNAHVIDNAEVVTVTLANRRSYPARVIGTDSRSDIGLIQIDADRKILSPLILGSSARLRTGEWVLAFGSPYEHVQTVTAGIISAIGRNSVGISDYEDFIQTDAAINPGNSGGPLVNTEGEVIGISTAYITQTGGYMGLGFAIPIDMAQTVATQLMKDGRMVRGWLGVALKDAVPLDFENQGLPTDKHGARIIEVKPGSPSSKVGLKQEDLIVRIGDTAITGAADLRNRIALTGPNSTVKIGYYRDGRYQVKNIMLGILK